MKLQEISTKPNEVTQSHEITSIAKVTQQYTEPSPKQTKPYNITHEIAPKSQEITQNKPMKSYENYTKSQKKLIQTHPAPYREKRQKENPSLLRTSTRKTKKAVISPTFARSSSLCWHASDSSAAGHPVLSCLREASRPRAHGMGTPFELVRRLVDVGN